MNGLEPIYVSPKIVGKFGFCASVSPEDVQRAFKENADKKISLVIVTSPTYEGVVSDVSAIAEIAHRHNARLFVDEAHGAHLGFDKNFPESSVKCGADVCVQSLHKTLPCFTQTAFVHIGGQNKNNTKELEEKLSEKLSVFETSSPSYIFMCGIDYCVSLLEEKSDILFKAYTDRLAEFSEVCKSLRNISVFGYGNDNSVDTEGVFAFDISKITITSDKISGRELYYTLKEKYGLQLEMFTPDSVLAVTSICDTDDGFKRLARALQEIDRETGNADVIKKSLCSANGCVPKLGILPELAAQSRSEFVPIGSAMGKICAGLVYAYPPGIPVLACGEVIGENEIALIKSMLDSGINLCGPAFNQNEYIKVVVN